MIDFAYDQHKNLANIAKHGISFEDATQAFYDPFVIIMDDAAHSKNEKRFFCFGSVSGEILTIRFTMRGNTVRIFGAAYWRKGAKIYAQENGF